MADDVFIAFQNNPDSKPIIDAIRADNAQARIEEYPAMVKVLSPGRLVVRKSTVSENLGREFDLQEIHLNLISLSGNVDETDDEFVLAWRN